MNEARKTEQRLRRATAKRAQWDGEWKAAIRDARDEGKTQSEIARLAGVTQQRVAAILKALALTVVLVVLMGGVAQAGVPFGTGLAQRLAAQQFPPTCAVTVTMVPALPPNDDNAAMFAQPSICSVFILSTEAWTNPAYLCVLMTHEYGHLSGLGHSTDPNSIMYPSPSAAPLCTQFFDGLASLKHKLQSARATLHVTKAHASRVRWHRRANRLRGIVATMEAELRY